MKHPMRSSALLVALSMGCASTSPPMRYGGARTDMDPVHPGWRGDEPAPSPDELIERRFVGQSAPPLDGLSVVSGDVVANWTALRGQLVVLEFWAPWCGVCRLIHDRLNEWQTQWAMYGVQVIGIAALRPAEARGFAARFGMGYSVAVDATESVFRSYAVSAVPSLFLVDRHGTIVDATTGYSSKRLAHMEKKLLALVGEAVSP